MNEPVKVGDQIEIGTLLIDGTIKRGYFQTVKRVTTEGIPVYRPKWAKVDKFAMYWWLTDKQNVND